MHSRAAAQIACKVRATRICRTLYSAISRPDIDFRSRDGKRQTAPPWWSRTGRTIECCGGSADKRESQIEAAKRNPGGPLKQRLERQRRSSSARNAHPRAKGARRAEPTSPQNLGCDGDCQAGDAKEGGLVFVAGLDPSAAPRSPFP